MATPTPPATPLVTPPAPSNLQASAVGCLYIELSWRDNSTNEYGFKVERSVDGSNFNQIDIVHHDVTTYLDHLGTSGLRYYRVRAYNGAGNSSYSNIASANTIVFCVTPTPHAYAYTHRNPAGSDRLAIRRFGRKYPIDTRYTSARRRHDHVAGRHFQLDASR